MKKYKKTKEGNFTMSEQGTTQTNYFTVKQFAKEKKFISESGIRFLIFNAETNGFNKVIKRIGKKILIDYNAFEVWLQSINETGGHS